MNKVKKHSIIIALLFIALGLILCTVGFCVLKGDFNKLNTEKQIEKTYTVDNLFENIDIKCSVEDIEFIFTDDGESRVVCKEADSVSYSVYVDNNTLFINREDNKKWYQNIRIGFYWENAKINVYLSETEFNSLNISSDTSNVNIPNNFLFKNTEIFTDTGDVEFLAPVQKDLVITTGTGDIITENINPENLTLKTDTGDISINSTEVKEKINLDTDTGEINLKGVISSSIVAESDTGNMLFTNVKAFKDIKLDSDTGNVKLISSDSQNLYIKTNTGNVYGTLLTEKIFLTESDTGSIDVPKSVSGGTCDVETDTGNIKFLIDE